MSKKHREECFKPHTMLHSLFGLGLGLLVAALFNLSGMTGVVLGLVVMAVAFVSDFMMGTKKK